MVKKRVFSHEENPIEKSVPDETYQLALQVN